MLDDVAVGRASGAVRVGSLVDAVEVGLGADEPDHSHLMEECNKVLSVEPVPEPFVNWFDVHLTFPLASLALVLPIPGNGSFVGVGHDFDTNFHISLVQLGSVLSFLVCFFVHRHSTAQWDGIHWRWNVIGCSSLMVLHMWSTV